MAVVKGESWGLDWIDRGRFGSFPGGLVLVRLLAHWELRGNCVDNFVRAAQGIHLS